MGKLRQNIYETKEEVAKEVMIFRQLLNISDNLCRPKKLGWAR